MARVAVFDTAEQLADIGAHRVATLLTAALSTQDAVSICLTGGHTPERLYQRLASEPGIDWARVHVFWGDERHFPPDHPDSNYGMAHRTLLSRVPVAPEHVHRMRGELPDPHEAARLYHDEIRDWVFDVMLLGVGEDAHIASIFPGLAGREGPPYETGGTGRRAALYGPPDRVIAIWAPHLNTWRITLTPAAILDSRAILVITAGGSKADAVHAALHGPLDVNRYPAQLVRSQEWLIDAAAAQRLDEPPVR